MLHGKIERPAGISAYGNLKDYETVLKLDSSLIKRLFRVEQTGPETFTARQLERRVKGTFEPLTGERFTKNLEQLAQREKASITRRKALEKQRIPLPARAKHPDYPLAKTSAMLVEANLGRSEHEPTRRESFISGDQSLPRIAARRLRERHQRYF
jgi:hypothetical protein